MLTNIILLIILITSLAIIFSILIKKIPLAASINVELMKQKPAEKKKVLLQQQLQKDILLGYDRLKQLINKLLIIIKKNFAKPPKNSNQ